MHRRNDRCHTPIGFTCGFAESAAKPSPSLPISRLLISSACSNCLIHKRYEKSVAEMAARAGVGEETLREYLHLEHPEAWMTSSLTGLVLGLYPDDLEELTRRWMRKFRRREKKVHLGEADWKFTYPWEEGYRPPEQPSDQA